MARVSGRARGSRRLEGRILVFRILLALVLIALWEWAGRAFGSTWTSLPSLMVVRLITWAGDGLALHIYTTLEEIVVGLVIGGMAGVALGLVLGTAKVMGPVLRPIIVGFYSVPIIALAPLLILWFGLDLAPKIVLVTIASFFLLFFNTFSGVQTVDPDMISAMRIIGISPGEEFRRVIVPGAMPWIVAGLKIAIPYAFAAAVTGELLAARLGLGSLLATAASQFDMTGLYAALLVLMVMGIFASAATLLLESYLLRWRPASE